MSWLRAPNLPPKIKPENMTISVCKVRGTYGIGILMNPPIPVKAAKRATRLSSRALSQFVLSLSATNSTLLNKKRLAPFPAGSRPYNNMFGNSFPRSLVKGNRSQEFPQKLIGAVCEMRSIERLP
jgi:hypothetical protein